MFTRSGHIVLFLPELSSELLPCLQSNKKLSEQPNENGFNFCLIFLFETILLILIALQLYLYLRKIPQILYFVIIRQFVTIYQNGGCCSQLRFLFPRFVFLKFSLHLRIFQIQV